MDIHKVIFIYRIILYKIIPAYLPILNSPGLSPLKDFFKCLKIFLSLFILREREHAHVHMSRGVAERERIPSRLHPALQPCVGLDQGWISRTVRSWPELKQTLNYWATWMPPTERFKRTECDIHTYMYIYHRVLLSLKNNEFLSLVITWKNLEDIMLCEVSQTEKDKTTMWFHLHWNLKNKQGRLGCSVG